jgi:uncharacterized phage-associated protein
MFREDKATQMAARFLTLAEGRLPYILLMKMLYKADKQMLVQRGKPITYDRWCSMKFGPVLSATLDLIRFSPPPSSYWSAYIATEGQDVVLKADPGDGDLSLAEDAIIEATFRDWGHKDKWEVVEMTHKFPEWIDPGSTSNPISYKTVLEVSGFSQEEMEGILENIGMQNDFSALKKTIDKTADLERAA